MNSYVMLVPIAILILTGTGIVSQAFATTITIETDSGVYDHLSIITITGTVNPVDQYEVPVIITIISPQGNIAGVAQISVNDGGSFSTTFACFAYLTISRNFLLNRESPKPQNLINFGFSGNCSKSSIIFLNKSNDMFCL